MEGTDNKPTKTKKELFGERLRKKYPEQNFDNEEDFFGRVNDDYDDYEKSLAGYKENEEALSGMFASDPRSARFLMDWKNGQDPAVQLVRMYGTEIKDAVDDPARQEEMAAANAEYVKRVSEEKGLEEQYRQNLDVSLDALETMQKEQGLTDEQVDAAMELLAGISTDFVVGKISPDTIRMMLNAINHDVDVATAAEDGEVKGRNARIDEKLRKKGSGDGTASLDGKNGGAPRAQNRRSLGVLDRMGDSNLSIYERGGEKRRKA